MEGLYELKRDLLRLEGVINPVTDICNELMRFYKGVIPKEVLVYFRDIADHTKRIDRRFTACARCCSRRCKYI